MSDVSTENVSHRGGCHCGKVSFVVDAPAAVEAIECNCSICKKKGFLHMQVAKERLNVVGEEHLSCYTYGTHTAKHLFCKHCGICSFYIPRSYPQGYSINVHCLNPETIESLKIIPFDGKDSYEQTLESISDMVSK